MIETKVLHGEGEPRIVIPNESYPQDPGEITGEIIDMPATLEVMTNDFVQSDLILDRYLIAEDDYGDTSRGKITGYNNQQNTINVDSWNNFTPAAGNTYKIRDKVIDLPHCFELREWFAIDGLHKTLYKKGRKSIKIRGFWYYAELDYSRYIEFEQLRKLQDVFSSYLFRPGTLLFYPRKDNLTIEYEVELNIQGQLNLAQLFHHQGHKNVVIHLEGVERIDKPNLISNIDNLSGFMAHDPSKAIVSGKIIGEK